MIRKIAWLHLGLLALSLAACRPSFVPPLYEAEIAVQLSRKDTSGATGFLYTRALGRQRAGQNRVTSGFTKSTTQTTAWVDVEYVYLGSGGDSDIYRLKRRDAVGESTDLQGAPAKTVTVRFNGKDPVVAWDDTRYIVIRPFSAEHKKMILREKYRASKIQGSKPLIGKSNYE